MIPEQIQKMMEEREALKKEVSEKQKEVNHLLRKERGLAGRLEAAWAQHYDKVLGSIRAIVGGD